MQIMEGQGYLHEKEDIYTLYGSGGHCHIRNVTAYSGSVI